MAISDLLPLILTTTHHAHRHSLLYTTHCYYSPSTTTLHSLLLLTSAQWRFFPPSPRIWSTRAHGFHSAAVSFGVHSDGVESYRLRRRDDRRRQVKLDLVRIQVKLDQVRIQVKLDLVRIQVKLDLGCRHLYRAPWPTQHACRQGSARAQALPCAAPSEGKTARRG